MKGLLVVYPDEHFDLLCNKSSTGRSSRKIKLAYRKTMLKYQGGPQCIEINKYSQRALPASLNAAFVILLLTSDKKLVKVE